MRPSDDLLARLNIELLQQRANGRSGVALSQAVWMVMTIDEMQKTRTAHTMTPSRTTSVGLKTFRGKVQQCLSQLAHRGLLYTRRKPEPGVQRYEHGETDKHFHFRISQAEAKEALKRLGIPERGVREVGSAHWTKSLGYETQDRQVIQ